MPGHNIASCDRTRKKATRSAAGLPGGGSMNRFSRIAGALATACMGATASAAGVQPINSEGAAARAVLGSTFLQLEAEQYNRQFAQDSRETIDRSLRQLN